MKNYPTTLVGAIAELKRQAKFHLLAAEKKKLDQQRAVSEAKAEMLLNCLRMLEKVTRIDNPAAPKVKRENPPAYDGAEAPHGPPGWEDGGAVRLADQQDYTSRPGQLHLDR